MIEFSQTPETFFVEEIPSFEPESGGEHLYVTFKRKGLSTPFIVESLRRLLKIKEEEIGYAGHKDKLATAVQTFSLPRRLEAKILKAFESLNIEVLAASPNSCKLRMGELLGNRFRIILQYGSRDDFADLNRAIEGIRTRGLANFFGPQRLSDKESFETGRQLFLNQLGKGGTRKRRFFVSIFQSHIFNAYLKKRIDASLYPDPIDGDVLLDPASEREFFFAEMNEELEKRLASLEIHFTGPIIGSKMRLPKGMPLDLEKEAVREFGVPFESIIHARAPGGRRAARIKVDGLQTDTFEDNYIALSFSLPKGSYATTLLKECGIMLTQEEKHRPPQPL
jgi:tRNA pseudouridine13 synthase